MTPKERAVHLVDSFLNMKRIKMSDYSVIYLPTAKECALITVEEVTLSLPKFMPVPYDESLVLVKKYWQEVKEEINNL